jgi:hypothetical protein
MRAWLGLVAVVAALAAGAPAGAADYRLLRIGGLHLKWGAPELGAGAGAAVSWGFAERAERFPDATNCRSLAPMRVMDRLWRRDAARLERAAAEAFAMWSAAADIEFRRARPGERPDILIGAQGEPWRIAFANVWHDAARAAHGVAPLTRATICFNPDAAWVLGVAAPVGAYELRTVLAHEIGHAIGLDHPGATGALMGFANQGTLAGLLPGDAAGGRRLYGDRSRVALTQAPGPARN